MKLENSIYIAAPPDTVWSVTVDVKNWPAWAPTVTSVSLVDDKPFGLGSKVMLKQPLQPEAIWTVTVFEPGKRFAWTTTQPGLRMLAEHELRAQGNGTTNILRLEASGPVALLLWPTLKLAGGWALSAENKGLKAHCEALS